MATGELAAEGRDGGWWPSGEWGAAVAEIDGQAAWRDRIPVAVAGGGNGLARSRSRGGGANGDEGWRRAAAAGSGADGRWRWGLAAVAAWRGRVPAAAMRVGGGGGERR